MPTAIEYIKNYFEQKRAEDLAAVERYNTHLIEMTKHMASIENHMKAQRERKPFYQTVPISATVAYKVDYRDRKHIYLYSANTLTLSLEDLGQVTIPQNTWINIGFQPGMFIYAVGQTATVMIYVRNTDETVP